MPTKSEKGNKPSEIKLSFFKYYKSLDRVKKSAFRKQVLEWCEKQPSTFQSWVTTGKIPPLAQKVIAEKMQVSREILFPQTEDEDLG